MPPVCAQLLFECRRYRRKGGVEFGTNTLEHRDNGDRDTRRDQTVLDRCSGVFVFEKTEVAAPNVICFVCARYSRHRSQ
jgi:hypothetical protein